MKKLLLTIGLCIQITCVQAVTFNLVSDSSLIGKTPGSDGIWNTADDFVSPGLNPNGLASYSYGSLITDGYEYKAGSFESEGSVNFGSNNIIALSTTATSVISGTVTTFTLSAAQPSILNIADDSTFSSSIAVDGSNGIVNLVLNATGQAIYNTSGQDDPFAISSITAIPGLADFFTLLKTTNSDWTYISTNLAGFNETFESGSIDWVISTDPSAIPQASTSVPEPSTLALVMIGLIGMGFSKKSRTVTTS